MKKVIAGLLGLVLSVMCVVPVMAQNAQSRYDAVGMGQVNYSLNSGGSFYGQEFNSGSASNWSLGFGSAQNVVGTAVLTWDSKGHTGLVGIGVPAVSACGASSSNSVALGSDAAGDVSIGTGSNSSCTLTFAAAYAAIPHCFCNDRKTASTCIAQPGTTSVTFIGTTVSSFASGDALDYLCIGN